MSRGSEMVSKAAAEAVIGELRHRIAELEQDVKSLVWLARRAAKLQAQNRLREKAGRPIRYDRDIDEWGG